MHKYDRSILNNLIDSVNLLYVAFTRAEKELFIISKKDNSENNSSSNLIKDFLAYKSSLDKYTIGENYGEVIEAVILAKSKFANKNIKEISLPKNVRGGAILRNDNIIIPNSETVFKINDDVVFFSEISSIKKLEKLLSINP